MFIEDLDFLVKQSKYSQRHFAKDFLKKYKNKKWEVTQTTFSQTLKRCFALQETKLLDCVNFSSEKKCGIFKLDFAVAGERQSPKISGNRLVFYLDNVNGVIDILLIYGKTHVSGKETAWIRKSIKTNFPVYGYLCVKV